MPVGQAKVGLLGTSQAGLVLIETQIVSNEANIDFTNIRESSFGLHFVTYELSPATDNAIVSIRFYESGTLESSNVYKEAWNELLSQGNSEDAGANSQYRSTSNGEIRVGENVGNSSAEASTGYFYILNAGNSSYVTTVSGHNIGLFTSGNGIEAFGGGVLTQTSTVDGFRLFDQNNASNFTGQVSLYGVVQ